MIFCIFSGNFNLICGLFRYSSNSLIRLDCSAMILLSSSIYYYTIYIKENYKCFVKCFLLCKCFTKLYLQTSSPQLHLIFSRIGLLLLCENICLDMLPYDTSLLHTTQLILTLCLAAAHALHCV